MTGGAGLRARAQLVPAVTELIIAELLYLQYKDRSKPIFLYINSTGTTRADGETVQAACPDHVAHRQALILCRRLLSGRSFSRHIRCDP